MNMATKFTKTLIGTIVMTAAFSVAASESYPYPGKSGESNATPAMVLVRAHKLTGQDEFQRERVLFSSEHGVLLSTTDVTRISSYLNPKQQSVPEGTYHFLRLELANEAFIYASPAGPVVTRLRNDGRPEVVSMSGVIRAAGGEFTPLALELESWRAPQPSPQFSTHGKTSERGSTPRSPR
jgi:hypothetical protein